MISPQWSCITGKGLAQDTTQPIATTRREVRVLFSVGLVCSHLIAFRDFYPLGQLGTNYIH